MRLAIAIIAALGCAPARAEAPPASPPVTPPPPAPVVSQADVDAAKKEAKLLLQHVEAWRLNHPGAACPSVDTLKKDDALQADQRVKDPWGTTFKIVCTGGEAGVTSAGPDRTWNSDDDVWVGTKPGT